MEETAIMIIGHILPLLGTMLGSAFVFFRQLMSLVEAIMRAARKHDKMVADMAALACLTDIIDIIVENYKTQTPCAGTPLKPFDDVLVLALSVSSPRTMRGGRDFHPERIPKAEAPSQAHQAQAQTKAATVTATPTAWTDLDASRTGGSTSAP